MMLRTLSAFVLSLGLVSFAGVAQADVDIQEVTSEGGLKAWLVEDHSIPFVALELRFRGGVSLDPQDKLGATRLMVSLLEEGTGDLDSRAFARAVEAQAAEFSYDASDDTISISAKFLSETKDASIELLKGSISAPNFDQESIDRVRGQVVSIIRSDAKDPGEISTDRFASLIYGDHPYARSENGTEETVNAITREDLFEVHASTMTRDRVFISAVGDITADELSTLIDDLLGDLPATGPTLPGEADLNLPGGVQVVDFDTPQSTAIFAQPGLPREHPDYFAAVILNHILGGGGFESRLMQEVREKRGLTYGVYSYLADKDGANLWMGSVASANDRIGQAIEVIRQEWQRIHNEGVTEQELNDAKTYITGAYPLRFSSNGNIANIAVGMQLSGLPIDYIATRNERMNAVTLEDIQRVARQFLDPDSLTFLVVGQPDGLESTIN